MMDALNHLRGMKSRVMVKFPRDQGTHGVQNQVVLASFGHLKASASCTLAHVDALSPVISWMLLVKPETVPIRRWLKYLKFFLSCTL